MTLPLTSPAWVFLVVAAIILVAPLAAEKIRLPGIIGLVVAGLVVGPEVLGLLDRAGTIEQMGGLGLLYLMFLAGLELDLDQFARYRRTALVFGVFTFVFPMGMGTAAGYALGFSTLASILLGSLWASHTLVAYPIIRRFGLTATRSVAATMGATVITDTLALLVLAVVAGSFQTGGGWVVVARLLPGLALLAVATAWALPRATGWFFSGLGQDRTLRFVFVLAAFLGSAALADLVGIEGIVGAFLAGLALNRAVPNTGALMERIEFLGSALLIPIFLISVGMLIDPTVVVDPETLLLAAVFTGVALGAKWLAAWVSGRLFGFGPAEIGTMFSLSGAQAAATLAATVVAFDIGLFGEQVVNAVLIVILATVIVTSWTATRAAARMPVPESRQPRLGEAVVVPVANPESAPHLVRLASAVARADGGVVVPLHVVTDLGSGLGTEHRRLVGEAERWAVTEGAEAKGILRVDASVAAGVVHTVAETGGSLVVLGWLGITRARDLLFGSTIDEMVARVSVPVVVARVAAFPVRRVILALDGGDLTPAGRPDVDLASDLIQRLQRSLGVSVLVVAPPGRAAQAVLGRLGKVDTMTGSDRVRSVGALAGPGDLVVVPGNLDRTAFGSDPAAIVAAAPDASVLVVAGAHRSGAFPSGLDLGIPGILGKGD